VRDARSQLHFTVHIDAEITSRRNRLNLINTNEEVTIWQVSTMSRRAAPDEFRLARIQLQLMAAHPRTDVLDTVRQLVTQNMRLCSWSPTVNLYVVGILVRVEPTSSCHRTEVSSVDDEQERSKDRSLWNAIDDRLIFRLSTAESNALPSSW
jgi:hypothetical protein